MTPTLLNVPRSQEEWSIWSFTNARDHEEIVQAIQAQGGPSLSQNLLDPIGPNFADYLQRNQQSHTDMNNALGLSSSDLEDLDPNDLRQLTAWIRSHHQEHFDARARLGI